MEKSAIRLNFPKVLDPESDICNINCGFGLLHLYESSFVLPFCNLLNDTAVGTSIFFRQNLLRVKNVADINQN